MTDSTDIYEQQRREQLIPDTITWRGPGGWRVVLDEDGPHLMTPKGDGLEWCDVRQILEIIEVARKVHLGGNDAPAPRPSQVTSWEQRRAISDLKESVAANAHQILKELR